MSSFLLVWHSLFYFSRSSGLATLPLSFLRTMCESSLEVEEFLALSLTVIPRSFLASSRFFSSHLGCWAKRVGPFSKRWSLLSALSSSEIDEYLFQRYWTCYWLTWLMSFTRCNLSTYATNLGSYPFSHTFYVWVVDGAGIGLTF